MAIIVEGIHHPLFGELSSIVGPKYCSDDDFIRICYSNDCSPNPSQVQGIVVRPANTDQVVQIVKLANLTRTPIVPSGGRASIYGAPPGLVGKGIVVDMTRMRKVLKIDEENIVVTAEAGITVAELTALVNQKGWDIHTALQPFYTDTVGGQISGVMGGGCGPEPQGVGWNGAYIMGVKVVLPDGSVLQTGAGPGTNVNQKIPFAHELGGPDITGMFLGDAGIFGIKVEATYRMFRLCKFRGGRAGMFDTLEKAWDCAAELSVVEPTPFTMICVVCPTRAIAMMMGGETRFILMCAAKGNSEEEIAQKVAIVDEMVLKHGGQVANDESAQGWVSDAINPKRQRDMGSYASMGYWVYLELMAPREQVVECITWIRNFHYTALDKNNIPYESINVIPCVGPNQWICNATVFLKGSDAKSMALMTDLWRDGLEQAAAKGWYPDATQGWASICVGKYWSPSMVTFMRNIKKALDPNNIMNPGLWNL